MPRRLVGRRLSDAFPRRRRRRTLPSKPQHRPVHQRRSAGAPLAVAVRFAAPSHTRRTAQPRSYRRFFAHDTALINSALLHRRYQTCIVTLTGYCDSDWRNLKFPAKFSCWDAIVIRNIYAGWLDLIGGRKFELASVSMLKRVNELRNVDACLRFLASKSRPARVGRITNRTR